MTKVPPPPKGAGSAGRRLWSAIMRDFELAEHEATLLRRAVAVADRCETLQRIVDADGPTITDRFGELKTHPSLVELRQQDQLLAKLIVALRVPLGDDETLSRPQRRGMRGVTGPRAVAR